MAQKLTYAEIRVIVQKDNTARLTREGQAGQSTIGLEVVEEFNREELVDFITVLRMSAGSSESVKKSITDFDWEKAKDKFKKPVGTKEIPTDVNSMMMMMMQQMKRSEELAAVERKRSEDLILGTKKLAAEERKRSEELAAEEKKREEELAIQAEKTRIAERLEDIAREEAR